MDLKLKEVIEGLQKKSNGIIFFKTGKFYIATGPEAIYLHRLFGIKRTCFGKTCKVGFPVSAEEKYSLKLVEEDISFNFCEKEDEIIKVIKSFKGNMGKSDLELEVVDCEKCKLEKEAELRARNGIFDKIVGELV